MKKTNRLRLLYLCVTFFVIVLGLLVRIKANLLPEIVNLYLGDALYAVMMFYGYSVLLPLKKSIFRAVLALVTCYCIEFFQLYTAPWITTIRATLPGRLILGQGFIWSDILAYTAGVAVAFCLDAFWHTRKKIDD
jgi:hypothetical protein